ncbi:MAG: GatB/YqeY domain-containing protein [Gammaproteobacteria bacterium]
MPPTTTLKERLQNDTNDALRAGDKERLSVLRLAMAAIKQREVDSRENLNDDGITGLLEKMVKQRNDSITQFRQGNRDDLVAKEEAEVEVLKEYLPEQLDEAETLALVDEVISATGASSPKDMGRVMGELKARAAGQIDMGQVSGLVKARLVGQ